MFLYSWLTSPPLEQCHPLNRPITCYDPFEGISYKNGVCTLGAVNQDSSFFLTYIRFQPFKQACKQTFSNDHEQCFSTLG